MSQTRLPMTREVTGNMFRQATTELLPHSIRNVGQPLETPLRWFEARYVGEPHPAAFSLWARMGSKTLDLTYNFNQKGPQSWVHWKLGISEDIDEPRANYMHTGLTIPKKGAIQLSQVRYQKSKDNQMVCVGGEWNFSLKPGRRRQLFDYSQSVLQDAVRDMPKLQDDFMKERHFPPVSEASSLQRLGSYATIDALEQAGVVIEF